MKLLFFSLISIIISLPVTWLILSSKSVSLFVRKRKLVAILLIICLILLTPIILNMLFGQIIGAGKIWATFFESLGITSASALIFVSVEYFIVKNAIKQITQENRGAVDSYRAQVYGEYKARIAQEQLRDKIDSEALKSYGAERHRYDPGRDASDLRSLAEILGGA